MKARMKIAALAATLAVTMGLSACGETEPIEEDLEATTTPAASATTTTTTPKITTTTTTTTTLPPLPVMSTYEESYEINNDLIGWIQVDGTPIDFPVLQSDDNVYYLTRDLNHEETVNGSIFADYKCEFTTRTRPANTILYGHNMRTGPSFAKLTTYYPWYSGTASLQQYLTAPTVKFDTIWEEGTYKIFAAMYVNTQEEHGEVFKYYKQRTITSEKEFYTYIAKIMDRSVFYTDVDLEYGDELLTLSTCYYPLGNNIDTRFVVFARRVREGEDPEVDTSKAEINYDPLYFDYYYQVMGGKWGGRKWDTSKVKGFDEFLEKNPDSEAAAPVV
ncbi:MAG: class B sortase [Bacteroides sp.]|nr:class B sortase [Eubacterium sp.]MCM1418695.1 class B sortase [Roseburia sp.]MCM1462723.1 class B sortase [Bacteroides sp.]